MVSSFREFIICLLLGWLSLAASKDFSGIQMGNDILRTYFWLFLLVGVLLVSLIIGLIFLFINKRITRKEKEYKNFLENSTPQFYTQSNQYHPKYLEEDLPPLPPRNTDTPQCPSTPSYEEIAVLPEYIKVVGATPPPPYKHEEPPSYAKQPSRGDRGSLDSYDDVVAPGYVSEDYDDVE